jgi:hypothetical protein
MSKTNYIELHPSKVVKQLTNNKKYTKKDMINFASDFLHECFNKSSPEVEYYFKKWLKQNK